MLCPVRCYTCNQLLANKCFEYQTRIKKDNNKGKVLDDIGLKRYCCRSIMMSYIEIHKN